MQLSAKNGAFKEDTKDIYLVEDKLQLLEWNKTAGKIFAFDHLERLRFMGHIYKLPNSALFHFVENGLTIGTGQVYIDNNNLAYIA